MFYCNLTIKFISLLSISIGKFGKIFLNPIFQRISSLKLFSDHMNSSFTTNAFSTNRYMISSTCDFYISDSLQIFTHCSGQKLKILVCENFFINNLVKLPHSAILCAYFSSQAHPISTILLYLHPTRPSNISGALPEPFLVTLSTYLSIIC